MPPSTTITTQTISVEEFERYSLRFPSEQRVDHKRPFWKSFKTELKWGSIIGITLGHFIALYGVLTFPYFTSKTTFLWGYVTGMSAGFGVTGGAHRLWCHRSYKAKLPLRLILMICYSLAGQNSIFDWVRDHRVHHKYSETDADPHNANRGFFFAHVGWLMMKKHPQVLKKGKQLDFSDLEQDPVVVFHDKYFWYLKFLICFIIPTAVPCYFWNETFYWSFMVTMSRYILSLNFTWSVNSAAHIFGNKPYDQSIQPVENEFVSFLALGEGWHNYHHTFPWDYKAAELGRHFNITTRLLDMFAKIGWAYDLKSPSMELVEKVAKNRGDGTWHHEEVLDDSL